MGVMTRSALPFVLAAAPSKLELSPERLESGKAQTAARFWAGPYTGSTAKSACVERILAAWRDRNRMEQVLEALGPEERTVLSVVRRYGGSISGTLLRQELLARGALRREDPDGTVRSHYDRRHSDPVRRLCERLVLVEESRYSGYYSYGWDRRYPGVSLPSQIVAFVSPAPPLRWKASAPAEDAPERTTVRAAAQMMADLEETARALERLGDWKINQGGGLPAAMRNRLAKLHPANASDPLDPPDRAALDYTILFALGAIECDEFDARLNRERADGILHLPLEVQASSWVRAWLGLRLWQDGIGAVPDRDSDNNPVRIDPVKLRSARELLVWALTRIAHTEHNDWLDLETFLLDFYSATGDDVLSFYWDAFSWQPHLATAARKEEVKGEERMRAYWMDQEGVWAANALLSTLVHLGVIERGRSGGTRAARWCFRLTQVGRAVFGAPEVTFERATGGDACLTVQPNHEVLLYLDAADGEVITTLGRIASRESPAGPVQTFRLTRDSVYGALEGGMTPAAIGSFLSSRSRSGLPANVSQSIAEWSRKREALVVRTGVSLLFVRDGQTHHGRAVGRHVFLTSPGVAGKEAKELGVGTESKVPERDWTLDEHGVVSPRAPLSITGGARLRRIARLTEGTWRITAESVRGARERGISADQILDWLAAHASDQVPPVLAMAIRNWANGRGKAFLGRVVLLQVSDPKAFDALRRSTRFRPFLRGILAPDAFVLTEEGPKEAARLLRDLGLSLDAECRLGPAESAAGDDDVAKQALQLQRQATGRPPGRRPRR